MAFVADMMRKLSEDRLLACSKHVNVEHVLGQFVYNQRDIIGGSHRQCLTSAKKFPLFYFIYLQILQVPHGPRQEG